MKKTALLASLCLIFLVGCSTTTLVTSNPPGADILLDDAYLGKTPMKCAVASKLGYFNKYIFKAEMKGCKSEMLIFQEPSFYSGAAGVIPPEIHFELKQEDPAGKED